MEENWDCWKDANDWLSQVYRSTESSFGKSVNSQSNSGFALNQDDFDSVLLSLKGKTFVGRIRSHSSLKRSR